VNRLQRQGYRLTITGSNAHLLSSELATHLTGRHIPVVLFPFSFAEYLRARGRDLTEQEKAEAFRSYVEVGGYPEPIMKDIQRREYLTTLVRSVLYKDIVMRHRIRSPQGMEDMAGHLMANVAQRYSLNTLAKVTRLQSVHTVEKYLRHLEEAFLFFSVRRFSFKVREQVRADRKIYCTDNGIVTSSSFRFSANAGSLYENMVGIALRKRQLEGRLEFFRWQSAQQEEVDFVVKKGTRIKQLVQVCADVTDPKTKTREVRALLKASADLRCNDLLILTETAEGEEAVSWFGAQGKVRFMPLWKWALADDPVSHD
jgi:predicted AAA+ superfamily ATPase